MVVNASVEMTQYFRKYILDAKMYIYLCSFVYVTSMAFESIFLSDTPLLKPYTCTYQVIVIT